MSTPNEPHEPTAVLVIGPRPQELGGFSDHNVFKLYVKHCLRDVLEKVQPAVVLTNGEHGVGMWSAETAVEIGGHVSVRVHRRGEYAHDTTMKHKRAVAALADRSVGGTPTYGSVREANRGIREEFYAARNRDKVLVIVDRHASPTVSDLSLHLAQAAAAGATVLDVDTRLMPTLYAAIDVVEALRRTIDDSIVVAAGVARDRLQEILLLSAANPGDKRYDLTMFDQDAVDRIMTRQQQAKQLCDLLSTIIVRQ